MKWNQLNSRAWERRQQWQTMYRVAPGLRFLARDSNLTKLAPNTLTDHQFLALAACFADPTKREILRALVLDLLQDDLAALLAGEVSEDFA